MQQKEVKVREDETHFLTPKKFEEQIQNLVVKLQCTHIEAIIIWCNDNDYDPLDTIPLLNNTLKQHLEIDGIESGALKKKQSLF